MLGSFLDRDTQDAIELDAWRSVFQRTDRILSGQKINVSVTDDRPAGQSEAVPAWSNGLDIFLSGPRVREMLKSRDKLAAVLRLKGLNYHELCHVLYTPRMTDEICRRLIKKVEETGDHKWWYAFNALEDQRIETWFAATYAASARYFEATVLEWIIRNGTAESAVLLYGRKYLTPRIRVKAARVFRKKYDATLWAEFQAVIDEYLTLMLPTDSIKAMQLIHEFVDLLDKMQAAHGAPLPVLVIADNGGDRCPQHGNDGVARQGRVYVKPVQRDRDNVQSKIDEAVDADLIEEELQEAEAEAAAQGGGQGQGEQKAGGGSKPQPGAGAKGDGGSDDAGGEADDASAEGGGSAAGASGSSDDHVAKEKGNDPILDGMDELADAAHEELAEVRDDAAVLEDYERMMDAVRAAENNGRMDAQGKAAGGATTPPSQAANMAVRKVHDVLSRIRQEAEPETLWRQAHGRVDGRRLVQRKPHETDIFKTWDHGNEEETGVEAVVLCDVSGSMQHELRDAAMAIWALKRAFDKLDIRTTVLMYDTSHSVLYQPSEKAVGNGIPVLRSGGGTNPQTALVQAKRILTKSQAPNKVLITVTDGSWAGSDEEYKSIMRQLHGIGVVSMLLGLDYAKERYGVHHHHVGHDMKSISDLPKAATKLVATIMRNALWAS